MAAQRQREVLSPLCVRRAARLHCLRNAEALISSYDLLHLPLSAGDTRAVKLRLRPGFRLIASTTLNPTQQMLLCAICFCCLTNALLYVYMLTFLYPLLFCSSFPFHTLFCSVVQGAEPDVIVTIKAHFGVPLMSSSKMVMMMMMMADCAAPPAPISTHTHKLITDGMSVCYLLP